MPVIAQQGNYVISSDFGTEVIEGTNTIGTSGRVITFSIDQINPIYSSFYWRIEPLTGSHNDFWEDFFSNRVGGEPADDFANRGFTSGTVIRKLNPDLVTENNELFRIAFYDSATFPFLTNPVVSATFAILDDEALFIPGDGASNLLQGRAGNDTLLGGAGPDTLNGGPGFDTLIGGTEADTMAGGAQDDTYGVDNFGDVVTELPGEGFDSVYASVSHTLAADVNALFLVEGAGALNGAGNALANALIGNSAANLLVGFGGDDVYGVNGSLDTVVEAAGGGYDEVYASGDFILPENVETLFLVGAATFGAGNSGNNAIIGNALDNLIQTGAGTFESLVGGAGNDTLIGGEGHDQLLGGAGADVFRLQNPTTDVFNGGSNDGDFIFDFNRTEGDKIQLNAAAFGFNFGLVDGANFHSGLSPAATQASPTLLYNTGSGLLFYDGDGSGPGGLTILAGLGGFPSIAASDFTLY